ATHIRAFDNAPAKLEIVQRQAKLHRENVYRPQRKKTQRGVAAREPVCDLINRSIAAGCNNSRKTVLNSAPGQRFRPARMRRNSDRASAGNRFDAVLPISKRFGTSCRRIENDNCISHTGKVTGLWSFLQTRAA